MYNKFTLTKLFFPSCPNEPTQVSPEIKTLVVNISYCKERIVGRHDQRKSGNDELHIILNLADLCVYIDIDTYAYTWTQIHTYTCIHIYVSFL